MTGAELIRAPLFHTPANPFHEERALVCHEDGGLLIRDGRIAASGDYSTLRAMHPEAATLDWRGGFLGRVIEDGEIAVGDPIRIL